MKKFIGLAFIVTSLFTSFAYSEVISCETRSRYEHDDEALHTFGVISAFVGYCTSSSGKKYKIEVVGLGLGFHVSDTAETTLACTRNGHGSWCGCPSF